MNELYSSVKSYLEFLNRQIMSTKICVNGLGRIGRLLIRCLWSDPTITISHFNDICSIDSAAYLLQYDTVHGTWDKKVTVEGTDIVIDGVKIPFSQQADPSKIPMSKEIEIVCCCTGKFLKVDVLTASYLSNPDYNIKKVIVSAPVKEPQALNVVIGCNDDKLAPSFDIITNASCTTNCIGPVVRVIKESFGIKHGCITTCHNVTGTQTLVDMPNTKKSDLRRARSGMCNLCPTSTGSATAITEVYPDLKGKMNGLAIRVPLLNASITDCVFEVEKPVTREEVNAALEKASLEGPLKGILGFETAPLVSTDYTNDERSSIVDALSTMVIDGTMVKIYAWYDNEMGYSKRMAELTNMVAEKFVRN
ncbi:hypothetical protein TrRE_jg5638 [Triparma retinervis]|uniref:glyceraldehyde-3-phosphate dehydrogenase (NADP(+)) (phosphorylating) n=1 Tax=Triparma retinervis TaxID=2557542 RepID=A0A9W7CEQ2_9STRA|nr:hypothetical protein TrRE_jg5638 [Triparma retinervis]